MVEELTRRLVADIAAHGPLPFEQFVEVALYDADHGFYATSGRAGKRLGDFVTSAETGPLFAAVIGDWLDGIWRDAGEPADFRVSEVGAGVGTLFRGINRAAPACFDSLTYTLVERSAAMRVAHESLPSERWRSGAQLPVPRQHVVFANELLDNLAFGIAERRDDGWSRVHVGADGESLQLNAMVSDPLLDYLDDLASDAVVGTRVPLAIEAAKWVSNVQARADHVLIFDYAATTAELASRDQAGWLRTYAGHSRGSNPLIDIGHRDITHDVPIDQLPLAMEQHTQADWLVAKGINDRVEQARQVWADRAHIGDLAAMTARSAIGEAAALTDPSGLGGFIVVEWQGHGA